MVIRIGKKNYRVSKRAAKKIVHQISEYVPFGIYAIEKDGQIELRNDRCESMTQLKELTRNYKQHGFKVHANKG